MKLVSLLLIVAATLNLSEAGIIKRMTKMPSKMFGKTLGMIGL